MGDPSKQWGFYNRHQKRFGVYDVPAFSGIEPAEPDNAETAFKEMIINAADPGKMVADLGCGDGIFTTNLCPYFKVVIGIEPSNLYFEALLQAEDSSLRMPYFLKMNATETAFKNGTFDLIISRRGPNPMAEIARLLKTGGLFVFITIGEQDAADLISIFGRGQMFGRKTAVLGDLERQIAEHGLSMTYGRNFHYQEAFPSKSVLKDFLERVPIFEDYGEKDSDVLAAFCRENTNDRGEVILSRHRVVVCAQKSDSTRIGGVSV